MSDKDDVRLLYQVLSSQIEFSKTQQWTMAYYTLLFIGGIVGFSELIYRNDFQSSQFAQFILFVLAVGILPIATACVELLLKNRDSMRGCREKYQKMWPHLSWPFNDGPEGQRLVGEDEVHRSCVYSSTRYDLIFWFPAMFLTGIAGVFSYGYLLVRFWGIEMGGPVWKLLRSANMPVAIVLSLIVFIVYHLWKKIQERMVARAQNKESKDASVRSIFKRIRLLVRWVRTGRVPSCAHSCLHALVIKCICRGQDPTEIPHSNDP